MFEAVLIIIESASFGITSSFANKYFTFVSPIYPPCFSRSVLPKISKEFSGTIAPSIVLKRISQQRLESLNKMDSLIIISKFTFLLFKFNNLYSIKINEELDL